jgi:hypothetical protein
MKLFDDDICHLTFTHSDCSDLWPMYFGEMKKFFCTKNHFVALNSKSRKIPKEIKQIIYNDSLKYPARLFSVLDSLKKYKYIFFDHEDMFLYKKPIINEIRKYYSALKEKKYQHIRLIKGGDCIYKQDNEIESLYAFDLKSKWIFSIQPGFWDREVLMEILSQNINVNIWDLETRSQKVVKKLKLKAAFSHLKGQKRGIFHYDNSVYPYIATALNKGRWNLKEYKNEIEKLFKKYRISPDDRDWY